MHRRMLGGFMLVAGLYAVKYGLDVTTLRGLGLEILTRRPAGIDHLLDAAFVLGTIAALAGLVQLFGDNREPNEA